MSEFYRRYIGKDLKQMVEEGDYASIRQTFLLDLFAFAICGFVICLSFVRAGWVS